MLPDPLPITFNGNALSLPRVNVVGRSSRYRSADEEFVMSITDYSKQGLSRLVGVSLSKQVLDPTPTQAFDPYRAIVNSFELRFGYDVSRYETNTSIPLLRSALNSFVDSAMLNRIISGEK